MQRFAFIGWARRTVRTVVHPLLLKRIVDFRSAKVGPFAERKTTMARLDRLPTPMSRRPKPSHFEKRQLALLEFLAAKGLAPSAFAQSRRSPGSYLRMGAKTLFGTLMTVGRMRKGPCQEADFAGSSHGYTGDKMQNAKCETQIVGAGRQPGAAVRQAAFLLGRFETLIRANLRS